MAEKIQSPTTQTQTKNFFSTLLSPKHNKIQPESSKSYSHLYNNDKSADTLNIEDPSTMRFNKEKDSSASASTKNEDKYEVFPSDMVNKSSTMPYQEEIHNILNIPIPSVSDKPRKSFAGITKMVGKIAKTAISDINKNAKKSMFGNDDYEKNLATALKFLDVSSSQSPFLKLLKQFVFFNIQIFIFLMNFVSVINIVLISSYKEGSLDQSWERTLILMEWVVGVNFGFEVLLTLLSSKGFMHLITQFFTFEVISNLLLIFEIVSTTIWSQNFISQNPFFTIVHMMRSFKLIKLRMIIVFNLKELKKIVKNDPLQIDSKNEQTELKYFVYSSALDILIGIFIEASIYLGVNELCYFEGYFSSNGPVNFNYIGAAYYAIVSLTTIGYGDIVPNYRWSRLYNIFVMFFNISVLSSYLSKMADKMYELSPYIRNFYYKNHIVIIGDIPPCFIKYFLKELYQCDYLTSRVYNQDKTSKIRVSSIILVGKENPHRDLDIWLENFSNDFTEIKYLKSNVMENLWYKQTNLGFARHLFAFSMNPNENQTQGLESDKQMAYNIQKVANNFPKLDITLVLSTEFSNQIKNDSLWSKMTVISANILNEYIMANSLENQGLNIWLTHLATLREKNTTVNGSDLDHLEEYAQNMSQEIYPIKLPHFFLGKRFQDVMKIIYFCGIDLSDSFSFDYSEVGRKNLPNRSGILLLGVEHLDKAENGHVELKFLINPVDYKIQKDDIGYVVAYDQENAKIITTYTEKSSLHSTYLKNMNLFKKLRINEASNKFIDKMRVHMIERLSDWKIKKQKYFKKTHLASISDFDSNLYEIPDIYNLYNNMSPKGIFRNHIIIKGDLYRLKRITSVLRSYSERPIILFSDKEPNPSEWHKIRDSFKNIFYVYGCPTKINHLQQIDPKKAFKILILSSNENNFIMDSESIIFTRIISDFFELKNFLTELIDENNLKSISINPKYENHNFFFWPYFLRGSVHFSSLAMSIIAKSINNKSWFSFIRNVTKPNIIQDRSGEEIQQNSKINTLTITPEIKKEFQFFGQLQYVLMSHEPPVIAIAVLKEKFTSQPVQNTLFRQITLSSGREKRKRKADLEATSKKSFQLITAHILKVMDNFYGSEFLMTNPSFLMPLDVGDRVLVIGNTRLEECNEYFGKMNNSSLKMSSRDISKSKDQEDIFNFSLNGLNGNTNYADLTTQKQKKKKMESFKERLDENLTNINDFMKFILNNWDDLHGTKTH